MDLIRLVWRNLTKHWVRSLLTVGSMVIALFLMCTLRSLVTSLEASAASEREDRLIVQSAVSLFVNMPLNYPAKIEEVEGVTSACKWQWFGGYYQEESNMFAQFAVDAEKLIAMYPEIEVIEGSLEDFYGNQQGCLVGTVQMQKFGWKLGDRIPLSCGLHPHPDGPDTPWEFDIAAVYQSTKPSFDEQTLFFNWKYFEETMQAGAEWDPEVGAIVMQIEPDADPTQVMRSVDEMFANGPQRVQTTTESEFAAQFVSMFGNVPTFLGVIGMGVFFAILLGCVNTMLMAAREQAHDVGILKSLGFSRGSVFGVLLAQSLLLCGVGGGLGILLAKSSEQPIKLAFSTLLPDYGVLNPTMLLGVAATVIVGLVAGLYPAWRASRLEAVEALRAGN